MECVIVSTLLTVYGINLQRVDRRVIYDFYSTVYTKNNKMKICIKNLSRESKHGENFKVQIFM